MPIILPKPTSVNILSNNIKLDDVFPYSFEDTHQFEDSTFSGRESNFINKRLILDSLYSNPSDDNPDAPDIRGAILNTSIPALCTGISVDFELNYKTPIVFSSCIKTEGEGEQERQISSFRALNGVSYGSSMSVAFIFGLSGAWYGQSQHNKYHFKWIFINQSCRASTNLTNYSQDSGKNICQNFYINADKWVTVYDGDGNPQGSIADIDEQGIEILPDWKFIPDNSRHIVEMYYNDILFDGQRPENVAWQTSESEISHDGTIYQNSWGTNSSGILSCKSRHQDTSIEKNILLQPFSISCGNNFDETNLSGGSTIDGRYYRHEIYLFGWKEYANITKNNIDIKIHPIKMKLHGAKIFWDKEIKPISHIIPVAISANSFNPLNAFYYDTMIQNLVPLDLRNNENPNLYDIGEIQTNSTNLSDENYCINIDKDEWDKAIETTTTRRPTYKFVDWSANEGTRSLPFSILPGRYDGSAITANYLDKNLVFSLEAVDGGGIVDTITGEPAVTLSSDDFPEDRFIYKGGYRVNGGTEVHFPSTELVETYPGHYENCVSMDGMMGFMINPILLKTPRPTMGESFTFMGWYRFPDYGDGTYIPQNNTLKYESQCSNVNNSNLSILGDQLSSLRYDSTGSNRHYYYLSSIQEIIADWNTKGITYETDRSSFGGWANFNIMSGKFKWVKITNQDDPDYPGYFTDLGMSNLLGIGLDTNDGYSGNKPAHDWRKYDVRSNINFTIYNYTTKKYGQNFNFIDELNGDGSSGQLVADGMSGNIDDENNLRTIADNIFNIKDNWTFFAISFDGGGYGGYYGQRRDDGSVPANEVHERGYRMGYIRNERGTNLHTNPSLSCLSTSYTLCKYPIYPFFSTGKEYDFIPWTIIGSESQRNYVKDNLIVDVTGNFSMRVPPYHFKYIRMFDRALKKDELDKIYETEKKMFYRS